MERACQPPILVKRVALVRVLPKPMVSSIESAGSRKDKADQSICVGTWGWPPVRNHPFSNFAAYRPKTSCGNRRALKVCGLLLFFLYASNVLNLQQSCTPRELLNMGTLLSNWWKEGNSLRVVGLWSLFWFGPFLWQTNTSWSFRWPAHSEIEPRHSEIEPCLTHGPKIEMSFCFSRNAVNLLSF